MIVWVLNNDVAAALKIMDRELKKAGIERQLRLRAIPKKSARRKFKERLSESRRLKHVKNQERRNK